MRYVSERCELGEQKEAVLAVTIPEQKGSFRHFCHTLEGRVITEFNYRYAGKAQADIFVGVRVANATEKNTLIEQLEAKSLTVCDLTDNELAKLHVRYMVGGANPNSTNEKVISF